MTARKGRRLGPYELERELARGGMGVVYAARHTETGVAYALKTIQFSAGALQADDVARFRREGELLSRLDHPGVVRVQSAGVEDGVAYLVQALLLGGSLQDRLHERGRLGWEEAVALVAELADAIAYAHAQGALHRDIKPDNVLFDDRGRPVLVDFGLGRNLAAESPRLTETGQVMGTPGYMAPEQVEGTRGDDPRTDVYGLGALLFALIAGRPPFSGRGLAILAQIVHDRPPDLAALEPDTPRYVAAAVACCLEKRPDERFPSAADLARALRAGGDPVRPRGAALLRFVVGACAVVSVALVAALAWRSSRPDPSPVAEPAKTPTPEPEPTTARMLTDEQRWKEAVNVVAGDPVRAATLLAEARDLPPTRTRDDLLRKATKQASALGETVTGEGVLEAEERGRWLACLRIHGRLRPGPFPAAMLKGLATAVGASPKEAAPFVTEVLDLLGKHEQQVVEGLSAAVVDFVLRLDREERGPWVQRCKDLTGQVRLHLGSGPEQVQQRQVWAHARVQLIRLLDSILLPRIEAGSAAGALDLLNRCEGVKQGVVKLTLAARQTITHAQAKAHLRLGKFEVTLQTAREGWSRGRDRRCLALAAIASAQLKDTAAALRQAREFLAHAAWPKRDQAYEPLMLGIVWDDLGGRAEVEPGLKRLLGARPQLYGWRLREVLLQLDQKGATPAQARLIALQKELRLSQNADQLQIQKLGNVREDAESLRELVAKLDARRKQRGDGLP